MTAASLPGHCRRQHRRAQANDEGEIVKRRILFWVQEEPTHEGDSAEDIYTAAYGSRVYSTAFVGYEGETTIKNYITVSAYRMDDIPDMTIEKLITNK